MMPMPMMPPQGPPPAMPIGAVPPGAPPLGAGAQPNPLAAVAQPGGLQRAKDQLMTFMAGMGAMDFVKFLRDLKGGGDKSKTTAQKEATGNPGQTQISPQLLAQLAARRQAAMQPSPVPGVMQGNPLQQLMPGR